VRRGQRWAGLVIFRVGPWAGFVVVACALLAAILVPFGGWHPAIALPLLVAAGAVGVRLVRHVPAPPLTVAPALACLAIAAGHGVWAALTHAEHVVLRRDAGSYALYTQWIASRHGLPIDAHLDAFGGTAALADPAFRLNSPAFYQIVHGAPGAAGTTADLLPQFLIGAPAFFSLGWWTGGWSGLFVAPAVASALALLAVAGLAARLIGPWWAALATGTLAIAQPVLHAARSTYSEPLAMLLVSAAAALLVDAVRPNATSEAARRLALAAGAAAGLAALVRVDALREVALLLPVAAVLALRRHPAAGPLVRGALAGLAVAAVPAGVLSYRYLGDISGSLTPLVAGFVVLGLGSWAAVLLGRSGFTRRVDPAAGVDSPGKTLGGWWAAALVGVVGLGLASRPLWLVVRQDPDDSGSHFVAKLQEELRLPVDGGRTYAEHSVEWVAWYLGPVAVAVAGIAVALLAARAVAWWRDPDGGLTVPAWLGPVAVGYGSALLTLWRPGITPDHPWADRRLVPVVLPLVVLLTVAALAWVARRSYRSGLGRRTGRVPVGAAVAAVGTAVLVVPAWIGTAGVATAATERHELDAVRTVCDALGPKDAVITLDPRSANEWPQVVRGICGKPASSVKVTGAGGEAATALATAEPARRLAERIAATGHRPVLFAGNGIGLVAINELGLTARPIVRLVSTEDQRVLTVRPDDTARLDVDVWFATWPAGGP
jgi:hypothetical protein